MENAWISAHLFYAGDQNQLLRLLVSPLVEKIGCPYFFIRYWEGGPHVRLRLYVTEEAMEIKSYITSAAAGYFSRYPSVRNGHIAPAMENDSLQYIPYLPEITRYGNAQSMHLAEQQFCLSSAYVLQQLDQSNWHASRALPEALKLNIALLYSLAATPSETLAICRRFIATWLPRVQHENKMLQMMENQFNENSAALKASAETLWKELENGNGCDALRAFTHGSRQVFSNYRRLNFSGQQLQEIVGSLLHMGHNRIGISNFDEAFIMYFTEKCLKHIYATT